MRFFKTKIAILTLIFVSIIANSYAQTPDCNWHEFYNGTNCQNCFDVFPGCAQCQIDANSQNVSRPVTCNWCLSYKQSVNNYNYSCQDCPISNCVNQRCYFDLESGEASCEQCYNGFYLNEFTNQCKNCSEEIKDCLHCNILMQPQTDPILQCTLCQSGQYFNISSGQCLNCSTFISGCSSCYISQIDNNLICQNCFKSLYFNESQNQCLNCSDVVPRCSYCSIQSNQFTCQICDDHFGNPYIAENQTCFICNETYPGCQTCSYNPNKQQVSCDQCSMFNYGFSEKSLTCQECSVPDSVSNCQQCGFDQNGTEICINCLRWSKFQDIQIYHDINTKICMRCSASIPFCQQCSQDFFTQNVICVGCISSFYLNKTNSQCFSCSEKIHNCEDCRYDQISQVNCLYCQYNYFLNSSSNECLTCNQIVPDCKNCYINNTNQSRIVCTDCGYGKYFDSELNQCVSCDSAISGCKYCNQQFDFWITQQLQLICFDCGQGQYFDKNNSKCQPCNLTISNCQSCNQQQSLNTMTLKYGLYCYSCGSEKYFNTTESECQSCKSKIPDCLGCYEEQLYNSTSSQYIYQVYCDNCGPFKYYNQKENSCQSCQSKDANCLHCFMNSNFNSQGELYRDFYCNQCIRNYYFNQTQGSCLSCEGKLPGCRDCSYRGKFDQNSKQFVTYLYCYDCGSGKYYDEVKEVCKNCSETFANCLQCGIDYQYQSLYPDQNINQKNQIICFQCSQGYLFNKNQNVCESCDKYFSGCLSCSFNYWDHSLLNDSSRAECEDCGFGKFLNRNSRTCEECNKTISGCGKCTQYIYQNTNELFCYQCSNSNKGFNKNMSSCEFCTITPQQNCAKCAFDDNGMEYCQQCNPSFYYNPNSKQCEFCSSKVAGCQNCFFDNLSKTGIYCYQCQIRMFFNKSEESCQSCSNMLQNCLICDIDDLNPSQIQCYQCERGYYYNQTSRNCMSCDTKVKNCELCYQSYENPNNVDCLECTFSKYFNTTSKLCLECNTQVNGCAQCRQDYFNYSSVFCNSCYYPQYFNPKTYACENCQSAIQDCQNCQASSGPIIYDKNGLQIYQGDNNVQLTCIQCKDGMFPNSNVCTNCSEFIASGCQICQNRTYSPCKQEMYCSDCGDKGKYYSLTQKTCLRCDNRIKGCLGCQEYYNFPQQSNYNNCNQQNQELPIIEFQCWWCGQNKFYNNITQSCDSCSATIQNCQRCYYDHNFKKKPVCSECIQGMFYDQNYEQCVSCSSKFSGCQNCFGWFNYDTKKSEVNCWQCKPGMALDQVNKICVKTMACEQDCDICEITGNKTIETVTQVYKQDPNNNTNYIPTNVIKTSIVQITQCNLCSQGFILDANKKCIYDQNCQPGKYFDGIQCKFCKDVINDCFSCKHDFGFNISCTSCFNDFELIQNLGICNATQGVQNCPIGCQNCTYDNKIAAVYCTVCQTGYEFNATTMLCELNCTLLGLNNCEQCTTTENQEYNYKISNCDKCWNGFALTGESKCSQILDCGENKTYYAYNGTCISCPSDCLGCKNIAPQHENIEKLQCDFCSRGFIQSQDKSGCIPAVNSQTIVCPPYCTNCSFISESYVMSCTQCENNYKLLYNTKIQNMNQPTFMNQPIFICATVCDYGCRECYLDKGQNRTLCSVCDSFFILNSYRNCVIQKNCQIGQFYDPNQFITFEISIQQQNYQCTDCPANCSDCRYSQSEQVVLCTQCKNDNKLTIEGKCIPKDNQNESNCPEGFYDVNQYCKPCPENCIQCNLNTLLNNYPTCTLCKLGFVYIKDQQACLLEVQQIDCKPNQYTRVKADPTDTKCYDCGLNCNSCVYDKVDNVDKCLACEDSAKYFLNSEGVCLNQQCSEKYIFNPKFGCEQCPVNCKMCSRNTAGFLQCLEGQCDDSYTLNQVTGQCQFDTSNCQKNNKTAYNNACLDCPLQCYKCIAQIEEITNKLSAIICEACSEGYKLQDGQCVRIDCQPNQYYGLSIENLELNCYNCTTGCDSCNYDRNSQKSVCLTCSEKYYMNGTECFLNQTSGTGAVVCAANKMYKLDLVLGPICVDCPATCSSCFYDEAKAQTYCKSCIENFILDHSNLKCLPDFTIVQTTNCTYSNQTFDYINQSCVDCPIGCDKCKQTFSTDFPFLACTNCSENYTWFTDWKCYSDCPEGEVAAFFSNNTQFCRNCMPNCKTCDIDFEKIPSLELCYVCEAGFYLSEGACQKYPQCLEGQFLTLNYESYLNYSANCKSCPSGCVACTAQNPNDQYSQVTCLECNTTTHSKDALGNCVVNYFNTKDDVECDTQMGFYIRFESTLRKFICAECPQGCQTCDLNICFTCQEGFLLENQQCSVKKSCNANQFYSKIANECYFCPSTCASCILNDVTDDSSLSCTNCKSGYDLSEGSCVQNLHDSDLQLDLTLCDNEISKYLVVINTAGVCLDCPYGCTKCKKLDPYNLQSAIQCSSCKPGYNQISNVCISLCKQNQYFSTATNQCSSCHFSCKECSEGTDKCLVCNENYEFSSGEGSACIEVSDNSSSDYSFDCGVDAYYDYIAGSCVCSDFNKYFDNLNQVCNSVLNYTKTCSIGQYLDDFLNECLPCSSRDEKGRCSMCSGPSSAQCQECIAGYYLDTQTFYCLPCAPGCLACTSLKICQKCKEGFYKYNDMTVEGDATLYCYKSCPVGTLPYLPSFYYLNPNLFTVEEIDAQLKLTTTISQSSSSGNLTIEAQAITAQQQPYYDNLPWSKDAEGFPTYLSQRINLECVPCLKGCLNCISKYLFIPDQSVCSTDSYCPDDYIIFNNSIDRYCVLPQKGQFAISFIDRPTLTLESGIQPLKKDLYIDVSTTLDNGTYGNITYLWSIVGVMNDITGLKLANPNTKQTIEMITTKKQEILKNKFLDEVKVTEKFLKVPASNLQQFLVYNLKVESTLHYKNSRNRKDTIVEYINITVRNVPLIRKTEDLGVAANLITVAPIYGKSGETIFKAKYSICNAPAYNKPAISSGSWKFMIKVQPANFSANNNDTQELVMQSSQCSDVLEFVVPADKKKDQNINVQFMFNFGENYYQAVRKVKALANPNFKLNDSQSIQKLNSSTSDVKISESDLAQSASIIHNDVNTYQLECPNTPINEIMNSPNFLLDGPCNTTEKISCCGYGTCVKGLTTTYRCQCNEGFSGQFCNIKMDIQTKTDTQNLVMRLVNELNKQKIDKNNVDSIVSTIKTVAQMQGALNSTIVEGLLQQILDASKIVTDSATLTALFDAIRSLQICQLNSEVSQDSQQAFQFQKSELDAMTSAMQSSAKQLSQAQPESSFSSGQISGKTTLVNPVDFAINETIQLSLPNSDKTQTIQIGINNSALNGYTDVAVSAVVSSSSLMSSANGSNIISSDNIEISLINTQSGGKIQVHNLTGECPISFNLKAQPIFKNYSNNIFQCVYLANGNYSSDGCQVNNTQKIQDEVYQITCCCNHLSLFSTQDITQGSAGSSTTNNSPQTTVNNGLNDSKLMSYLVLLIGLFVVMIVSI